MTVSIYGRSYNVKRGALRSDFLNLIMDEDTFLLYVAQNKEQVDDFDTLLAINIECQKIIPMFLSVFNEMVEEYFIPVKYNCPAVYIINADASNYVACDNIELGKKSNVKLNNYIGYVLEKDILYVCPTFKSNFTPFGTTTKYMQNKVEEPKRKTLFEKILGKSDELPGQSKREPAQAPLWEKPQVAEKPVEVQQPAYTPAKQQSPQQSSPTIVKPTSPQSQQPVRRPVFDLDDDKPATNIIDVMEIHKPKLPKDTGVPPKEKLFKYCSYDENCLVVNLVCNDAIGIVNKRTGQTSIISLDDIIKSIPEYTKQTAIMEFGRCITFAYEVNDIKLLDIRTLIRLFEDKKNDPVNKQLITYSNKILSFALASETAVNERISIKDFTIQSHREATSKYNQLKEHFCAFSKHIYFISTSTTSGIIMSNGTGKENKIISFDEIYEAFPECKNIGDIMRMFPVEYILDAAHLGLSTFEQILGVTIVSPKTLAVCGTVYQIKDAQYGYDSRNKCIMATK